MTTTQQIVVSALKCMPEEERKEVLENFCCTCRRYIGEGSDLLPGFYEAYCVNCCPDPPE